MKIIGTYGSLKEGYYNHYLLGKNPQRRQSILYPGVLIQARGQNFPRLLENNGAENPDHLNQVEIEVYMIGDNEYNQINKLETDFGYYPKEVDGVTIFFSKRQDYDQGLFKVIKSWPEKASAVA